MKAKHGAPTRVVLTLVVRNEADIIESNLRLHLGLGVEVIYLMDTGSNDHTLDIVHAVARETGRVKVFESTTPGFDQSRLTSGLASQVADDLGEGVWIISGDADEFWLPVIGSSLPAAFSTAPRSFDALAIPRTNLLPTAMESEPWWERMTLRDERRTNTSGNPLRPKVVHRSGSGVVVEHGNLAVHGDAIQRVGVFAGVEQVHVPMRTFTQFRRKVEEGSQALDRTQGLPEWVGGTWKRLARRDVAAAEREYRDLVSIGADFLAASATGLVVRDTRLARGIGNAASSVDPGSVAKITGGSWRVHSSAERAAASWNSALLDGLDAGCGWFEIERPGWQPLLLSSDVIRHVGLFDERCATDVDAIGNYSQRMAIAGIDNSALSRPAIALPASDGAHGVRVRDVFAPPVGNLCSADIAAPDSDLTDYALTKGLNVPWSTWRNDSPSR